MRDSKSTDTQYSTADGTSRAMARPVQLSSYAAWTIEELRELATQLQLPDAMLKTRRELLEILDGDSAEL